MKTFCSDLLYYARQANLWLWMAVVALVLMLVWAIQIGSTMNLFKECGCLGGGKSQQTAPRRLSEDGA